MQDREVQRQRLVQEALGYVVANGLTGLSLRPLAATLGTSDRMLLYYFGTKDDLVESVLAEASVQLQAMLGSLLPPGRVPPATLLGAVAGLVEDPAVAPVLALSTELLGLAARGQEPYATAARGIVENWLQWVASRVDAPARQRAAMAATVLAAIEGLLVISVVGDEALRRASSKGLVALLRDPAAPRARPGRSAHLDR